jgi:flagellar biosynthesis/type III secretory pathway protein FliH
MSIAKQMISGLENALKEATKIGFKKGGETVLKEFAPHAGRALKKGDGSIMATFNTVKNQLKKL